MDNRAIGVFDSGLGGLTTVKELHKIMPNEDIIYFGDTSRVPYGTRSHETILKYAKQDIRFLLSKNVKAVIVACNTAAAALQDTSDNIPEIFCDALNPAAHTATTITKNNRIGIIGTASTAKSGAYEKAIEYINSDIEVFSVACPLFVPLVENGYTDENNEVTILVAKEYLKPIIEKGVDTLILGCTHYPIIKNIIKKIVGDNVTLIDSGAEAARQAFDLLNNKDTLTDKKTKGICTFYVSDSKGSFYENAKTIVGEDIIGEVLQIDIEKY